MRFKKGKVLMLTPKSGKDIMPISRILGLVGNKNISLLFSKGDIDEYNMPSKCTKIFL